MWQRRAGQKRRPYFPAVDKIRHDTTVCFRAMDVVVVLLRVYCTNRIVSTMNDFASYFAGSLSAALLYFRGA